MQAWLFSREEDGKEFMPKKKKKNQGKKYNYCNVSLSNRHIGAHELEKKILQVLKSESSKGHLVTGLRNRTKRD